MKIKSQISIALTVLVSVALTTGGYATKTESFFDDTVADFSQGEIKESTLTDQGVLLPPPSRTRLGELDESVVWDLVELDGVLYIATGHEGKLMKQSGDDPAEMIITFQETSLYALAVDGENRLLIGASPGGRIYTLDANEAPVEVAQVDAEIIWRILPTSNGIIVATGPEGKIFRIDADGNSEEIAALKDTLNILDMEAIPDSEDIVFAAQGPGIIGRLSPDGTVRVLLDPEQEEVRRVAVMPDGSILGAVNGIRSPGEKLLVGMPEGARAQGNQKPMPSSFVARIHPSGFVEEWWTSPENPIHDLHAVEDGSVVISAGNAGNLYRVNPDGKTDRIGIAREEYLTRLAPAANNTVLIGTGAPAALYRLEPATSMDGVYDSRVLDGKGTVRWGRLVSDLDVADGMIRVRYRTGNTAKPDPTWSDWSEPTDFAGGTVAIDSTTVSRFFQYRLEMTLPRATRGGQPSVDNVRVFYTRPNVAPRISSVTAAYTGERKEGQPRRNIEIAATATDPNGDTLRYNYYIEPYGSNQRLKLVENHAEAKQTFDSTNMADGRYRAVIIATDAPSNPAGEELTAEQRSPIFTIDNTAPTIEIVSVDRTSATSVTVKFVAADAASNIIRATWRIGTETPRLVLPEDGLFDQKEKSFTLRLEDNELAVPGALLTLLVADENENVRVERITLD